MMGWRAAEVSLNFQAILSHFVLGNTIGTFGYFGPLHTQPTKLEVDISIIA